MRDVGLTVDYDGKAYLNGEAIEYPILHFLSFSDHTHFALILI